MTGDPTSDLDVQRLLDIEAIKQVKGRYTLYMDTKEWDAWRELFTPDFVTEGTLQLPDVSRELFVDGVRALLEGVQTCHQVHSPIIEFTGQDTARVVWSMFDDLRFPEGHAASDGFPRRLGYGHYEEEYRKDGGHWRISFLRLVRLFQWREPEHGPAIPEGIPSGGLAWLEGRRAPGTLED